MMFHCSIVRRVCHVQQLEREVRQALAASSIGGSTPAGARLGALLDAHTSDSSPLTFASSQFSPSERHHSQVSAESVAEWVLSLWPGQCTWLALLSDIVLLLAID